MAVATLKDPQLPRERQIAEGSPTCKVSGAAQTRRKRSAREPPGNRLWPPRKSAKSRVCYECASDGQNSYGFFAEELSPAKLVFMRLGGLFDSRRFMPIFP